MDLNDFYDAGGDLVKAVNDAVSRNDFSDLSDSIRKTVKDVTETIQRDVRQYSSTDPRQDVRGRTYRNTAGQGGARPYGENPYRRYRSTSQENFGQRMSRAQNRAETAPSSSRTAFIQKFVSRQTGLGKIVGGIMGLVVLGPVLLGQLLIILAGGVSGGILFGLLATALLAAACVYFIKTGKSDKDLVKRYYEYGKVIGDAEYIEIAKLAKMTGRTKEEVLDDLHKLMDQKILTQAWIDDQETTLILTEEVYNQYQEIRAQSERLRRQAEQVQEADADLPENAREIIKEGQDYIRTIHSLNEDIPGAQMSEKLYRLEGTMERIMEQVRKNPESASELRKLMSYYLPTTVKLLNAYKELDKQAAGGDNITKTKKEIEDALDTINDAFENLLDSMFRDIAWDVSSDISVMQTMLAQDGLTPGEMAAEEGQTTEQKERDVYGTPLVWGDGQSAVQAQVQEEKK